MSKKVKGLMQGELRQRYDGVDQCLVVSVRGMSGVENNELRGALLAKDMRLNVVKNSLARRAFAEVGMEGADDLFDGPCAVVVGGDNIVDAAKVVKEWADKLEHLVIKGGYVEGQVLDDQGAIALSKMPNRRELQSRVVGCALSPGSQLALPEVSGSCLDQRWIRRYLGLWPAVEAPTR